MSLGLQSLQYLIGKAALHMEQVVAIMGKGGFGGAVGVSPAGSLHSLGNGHAEVQDVSYYLQVGLHLGVCAGSAANQYQAL